MLININNCTELVENLTNIVDREIGKTATEMKLKVGIYN